MLGLTLAVVGIALPDSINPSLIVAAVYVALGPRPRQGLIAFTAAAFMVTLAGGLVVALGLGDLILSLLPKLSRSVKYQVMTLVGIALICGGAAIWWRRRSLGGDKPSTQPSSPGHGSAALLGAGIASVELLTAFPYFAAIAMIVGSSASAGGKVLLLVIYNIVYVLPLIAITLIAVVMGDRAARVLAPVGDWVATRWPIVVAPLVAAAGLAVTVYGVVQLTTVP
jgi:cytochrome c biogenesis protein CcdA